MKKTNSTRTNWFNKNPFFNCKEAYDNFVDAMMTAADEEHLPICLQHEEPETLTMSDMKQFSQRFKQDTGLYMEFKFVTCNHCDRLHCCMVVDKYPEGTEGKNIIFI